MIRLPLDQPIHPSQADESGAVRSTNCGKFVRQPEGLSAGFQWLLARGGICVPDAPVCSITVQGSGNADARHHGRQALG